MSWWCAIGVAVGLTACADRSREESLESPSVPLTVKVATRDFGDRGEWDVRVGATPGSESWFERAAGHMVIGVPGRQASLRRGGTGLEGRWVGGRWERPALTWEASDGSAGMRVELTAEAELGMPRFVDVERTGIVGTAVPILSGERADLRQMMPRREGALYKPEGTR